MDGNRTRKEKVADSNISGYKWTSLIKDAMSCYLLSLYKVKRVFASMNFKKQWSSFIIFAYI